MDISAPPLPLPRGEGGTSFTHCTNFWNGDEGADIKAADTGVDAGVTLEIDGGEEDFGESEEGLLDVVGRTGESGDCSVVVNISFGEVYGDGCVFEKIECLTEHGAFPTD